MSVRSKVLAVTGTAAAVALLAPVLPATADNGHGRGGGGELLDAPLAGSLPADSPLFGLNPGGAPWVLDRGEVRVRDDGRLDVRFRGFVIPGRGNPVPALVARLACGGALLPEVEGDVALTPAGDGRFRGDFDVPDRCTAPVVLFSPRANQAVYIAVTGVEAD